MPSRPFVLYLGAVSSCTAANKENFLFRFFGAFFEKVLEDFGKRRRKRRPGAISAPYGAPTEPRCVSAFGNAPSLPPPGFRPSSGRRGSTHSPRRYDFTRQHASARDAIAETVQPRSVSTLRRECSAGATAFYRPPFHCGRHKAMKQGTASRIHQARTTKKELIRSAPS